MIVCVDVREHVCMLRFQVAQADIYLDPYLVDFDVVVVSTGTSSTDFACRLTG